jgi:uncharacterized protein
MSKIATWNASGPGPASLNRAPGTRFLYTLPPRSASISPTVISATASRSVESGRGALREGGSICATEREVSLPWAPSKTLAGDDYLIQITIPNTYFHLTMAYATLRHNGVDVGKMDFLGPIHWR